MTAPLHPPPDADLAAPSFWERSAAERSAAFAALRALEHPVFVVEEPASGRRPARGSYALVRHADVVEVSRNPAVFSSEPSVTTPAPSWAARTVFGESMVNTDNPRHARLRHVVARAFSTKVMAAQAERAQLVSRRLVDDVVARGAGDFVVDVAAPLPLHVLCDMLGVPDEERSGLLARVDASTASTAADSALRRRLPVPGRTSLALLQMHRMIARLGRERRRHPTDDLITALVTAEVDGRALSSRELGAFFSLLLVAGVETTRNAIAHALHLFTRFPDQRALLLSDLDRYLPTAVEEVLRFETPIVQFRRTVRAEHDLRGLHLVPGDVVTLYYASANRDEAVFADPEAFDITRSPNPHLAFGGAGAHHCLGKLLARTEMVALFRELFTRLPDVRSVGDPVFVASNFDHRIRHLPYTLARP